MTMDKDEFTRRVLTFTALEAIQGYYEYLRTLNEEAPRRLFCRFRRGALWYTASVVYHRGDMAKRKSKYTDDQRSYVIVREGSSVYALPRATENAALQPEPQFADGAEKQLYMLIHALDRRAAVLNSRRERHLYGAAKVRWIAAQAGCTLNDVRRHLGLPLAVPKRTPVDKESD